MAGRVSGKVVLITGAASGLGAESARRLAIEGAHLVLTDMASDAGSDLAQALTAQGHQALFLTHDVTDEARWSEVAKALADPDREDEVRRLLTARFGGPAAAGLKALLAAAPLEEIDLERSRDTGRALSL